LITTFAGAILLDTCNFSEQVGKATAKDVQISHQLRSRFYDLDVTHFYISINEAKYSIEGLSTCDLLIKVNCFFISVVALFVVSICFLFQVVH